MPFVPDVDQRELLLAQNYLIRKKNGTLGDHLLDAQGQEAYEKIFNKISNKLPISNVFSSFISEKGYQITEELTEKYLADPEDAKKYNKDQLRQVIVELHDKLKISEMKSINHEAEYSNANSRIEPETIKTSDNSKNIRYSIYKS
jgi:hypothetical protein